MNCIKCNKRCKLLYYEMWPQCSRGERQYLAMEGNGFDGSVLDDGVKLWYPTYGESVQPLQSVKFIRITMSAASDGLWFGFNSQMGWVE